MPMDAFINRDWHLAVASHVKWCEAMGAEETVEFRGSTITLKFSNSTPKLQTEAYLRLWDQGSGWDLSKRIIEDVRRFLTAATQIRDADGSVVHNYRGLRNGHRAQWELPNDPAHPKGRGGRRTKGPARKDGFRHADIKESRLNSVCTASKTAFDARNE
jgi:hypothetical protein